MEEPFYEETRCDKNKEQQHVKQEEGTVPLPVHIALHGHTEYRRWIAVRPADNNLYHKVVPCHAGYKIIHVALDFNVLSGILCLNIRDRYGEPQYVRNLFGKPAVKPAQVNEIPRRLAAPVIAVNIKAGEYIQAVVEIFYAAFTAVPGCASFADNS